MNQEARLVILAGDGACVVDRRSDRSQFARNFDDRDLAVRGAYKIARHNLFVEPVTRDWTRRVDAARIVDRRSDRLYFRERSIRRAHETGLVKLLADIVLI